MSSGNKGVFINNQERAVSLDINRAQSFEGTHVAQVLRFLIDARANEDDANGVTTVGAAPAAPMRAEILNGLLVKPEVGGTNIFVDPGVAVAVSPDTVPSPDDIALKVIVDPGVVLAGALVMTSNVSGQNRVDVVECAVDPDVVLEVANRDIFNNGTGLFTATTVPKVKQSLFKYRVRLGAPGAGYPAPQTGWLPLMVMVVPNAAASLNDCMCWDVRPLWSDRKGGVESAFAQVQSRSVEVRQPTAQTTVPYNHPVYIAGNVELTLGGRRLGGNLSPHAAYLDLNDANYLDPGFFASLGVGLANPIFSQCFFVWLVTPFGLPRWAPYTPYTLGTRIPQTPRGMVVLSLVGPDSVGNPLFAIQLPTGLGFGVVTSLTAKLAHAGMLASFPLQPMEGRSVGRDTEHIGVEWNGIAWGSTTLSDYMPNFYGSITSQDGPKTWLKGQFSFIDNVTHPKNATHVSCRFGINAVKRAIAGSAGVQILATLVDQAGEVYWKKAITVPIRRDPPAQTFTQTVTLHNQYVWALSAPSGETIAGVALGVNPVNIAGALAGDVVTWWFNAWLSFPGQVLFDTYLQETGGVKYASGAGMIMNVPSGDPIVGTYGHRSQTGQHVVVAPGAILVNVRTLDGVPLGLASNGGLTILTGDLVVTLTRTVAAPPVPVNSDVPMYFTLEDIPLRRGGGPLQGLFLVVDGRPEFDVIPALASNPHTGADVFAMDVIGWKLGA